MKVHLQSLFIGFVAGAATAVVAPFVVPAVSQALRPTAKVLLKQGLLGVERVRLTVARASEAVEDLLAEVRSEVEAQLAPKSSRRATSAVSVDSKSVPPRSPAMVS